jgi:phenylpropionate dioxygenase-like ring-hydroxylating dioxygenase large terminal subunit
MVAFNLLPAFLLPFWYPIALKNEIEPGKLYRRVVDGVPFTLYKHHHQGYRMIHDACPHQGASLSAGRLDTNSTVVCPYHAFRFRNGCFCGMPSNLQGGQQPTLFRSNISVLRLLLTEDSDIIYARPDINLNVQLKPRSSPPFQPTEEFDRRFSKITGCSPIDCDADAVTENVLDMLHISFIHGFGNLESPMPLRVKHRKTSNISGVTTFHYRSGPTSLSRIMENATTVVVENEYHLPSTTVTRVTAGSLVKTVVTRALRVEDGKTLLFWTVYRNFWNGNSLMQVIGDYMMRMLMERTIEEDKAILKHVYVDKRFGTIETVYDQTILAFRKAKKQFMGREGSPE